MASTPSVFTQLSNNNISPGSIDKKSRTFVSEEPSDIAKSSRIDIDINTGTEPSSKQMDSTTKNIGITLLNSLGKSLFVRKWGCSSTKDVNKISCNVLKEEGDDSLNQKTE
ncbi:unnamed protein product [Lepeophtheirus salmonis]|uniref:(salmon louse) hypothetical protein n=1 Tax=Lepeophtheirus salmonis TaxID=72036 RepID=A0A7R8CKJ3_LEPSM|nr:unnamed protein product [Lepeophtheirus salmonis]CAF2849227.1 unnamed protein product [Lepeophtheirus salmonis]